MEEEYKCNIFKGLVVFSYAFIVIGQLLLWYSIYVNRAFRLTPVIDNIEVLYPSILIVGFGIFLNMIPKENLVADEDNPSIIDRNRIFACSSLVLIALGVLFSFVYSVNFTTPVNEEHTFKKWFSKLFVRQAVQNMDTFTPIVVIVSAILTAIGFYSMFLINFSIFLFFE